VTAEEEARAAELEAAILAEEEVAAEARKGRSRRSEAPTEATIYSSAPLAERAAQEYGYVQRDLRRIVIVGGGLLLVLVVLDILVNQLNLI
jgi:hypothetical protein